MARRHVGVVSLRVGFLIRDQSSIFPSVLWAIERLGPSATKVDLTGYWCRIEHMWAYWYNTSRNSSRSSCFAPFRLLNNQFDPDYRHPWLSRPVVHREGYLFPRSNYLKSGIRKAILNMASEAGWLGIHQYINQSIFSMPNPDLKTAYFEASNHVCSILDVQKIFPPSAGVLPAIGWLIATRPITALVWCLSSLWFVAVTWKVML